MYLSHFGLQEQPFSIAPDPSFLYLSEHHQEALGHLLYGAGQTGGFVALTGEVGTGKTTLVRTLLEQKLDKVDIALCLNPGLSVNDFVESLCDEFDIAYAPGASLRELSRTLNKALLESHAAGRHSVAIIDEAQNLSREVLEQIRLLTNLETNKDKLLRIILVGQPELQQLLARNDLRQLAQRITARYHLGELSKSETKAYIQHRLSVAGTHNPIFTGAAIKAIFAYSAGTPRLINIICDRALTIAYAEERSDVKPRHVKEAATELLPNKSKQVGCLPALAIGSLLLVIAIFCWQLAQPMVGDLYEQLMPSGPDVLAGSPRPPSPPIVPSIAAQAQPVPVEAIELQQDAEQPLELPVDDDSSDVDLDPLFEFQAASEGLLARWQVEGSVAPARFCRDVLEFQLRCLLGEAAMSEILNFNRPAMLRISRPGAVSWSLLQAVDGDKLILQSDAGLLSISRVDFESYWTGEYRLLLRMPAKGIQTLRPGQVNAGIGWLREQVALYDGVSSGSQTKTVYDATLKRRVENFQARNGLEADGVVGGKTLTLLQNLSPAAGTPLLQQVAE
jgi:general secretion pathway protein A